MFNKSFLISVVCFLLSTVLIGCTTIYNPATGRKETYFIDTAQEVAIGESVAREVLRRYKILDDGETQRYVQEIGEDISSVSDRRDVKYSFTVLDNKELNAFALPGGKVYVNKGLVDRLDKDELVCVLAHEVGHISARHAVKRIQGQISYQVLMSVAMYQIGKEDRRLAKTVTKGADSIFNLILLGYSRKDELLADKLAIKYAYKAEYNPRAMVTALRKLEEESKKKHFWEDLAVLRSHPYLEDRIRAAEAEAGLFD